MGVPVLAIVGAGASHASGDYGSDAPPLTRDLFTDAHSVALLGSYPLARMAGRTIARDMKESSTLAFEQALLNLRTDGYPHHEQMSRAIPPFLQALLLSHSDRLHAEAFRYDVLVDELLKLPTTVHFVSLNYDTLLDATLSSLSPLNTMNSYINTSTNWTLIKPHGSVNWFVNLGRYFDPTSPSDQLELVEGPIECVPTDVFDLRLVRGQGVGLDVETTRYPAIALPEGPKDRLVLPPDHLVHLNNSLRQAGEVDVLVLGYSALDSEVLDLIRSSGARVRRMTVVNRDQQENLNVLATIQATGIKAVWPDVFDGTYAEWIDNDGLRTWVREFDGPYPSLTDPASLKTSLDIREHERRVATDVEPNFMTRPM